MRGFFHLLYHQFAWNYDWVSRMVSLGMWQDWIAATLPYLQGPYVLELGPGPGHIQQVLAGRGVNSIALEASPQMARLAYSKVKLNKNFPDVVIGYAQFMPFRNSTFDQVLATFPTDYIFDPDTIQQIDRILQPGGTCFILPAAWITAPALPFRVAARLFELTGQVPIDLPDWAGPFTQAGFTVELIPIELPRSRLILIRAVKAYPRPE
jgi:ubiquinone/menaquinone biosynthesis C-methylase UbiE